MALADRFDGLLVDLDGVVWVGRQPVPGAAEALRELLARDKEVVFVTNNPGKPPSAYGERLREMGIAVGDDRIVTAGIVTAGIAAERVGAGSSVFVIGATAFKDAATAAGLRPLDGGAGRDAAAVLVSSHRGFDYEELLTAVLALQRGAALFATSRDPNLPMPDGLWPGTGAILAAVETASGAVAEIGGKPERHLFDLARQRIGDAGRVAIVGDRPASDIEGGRRAGLETILVLSGATSREEAATAEAQPDHIADDLAALLR
jgi:HAD superfamily hydrolase (TIGR01450 family)